MIARIVRALRRKPTRPALPVYTGARYCPLCWTPSGRQHELSCPEVTVEQFIAYLEVKR